MIYTTEDNRYLKYSTPLIEYIKTRYLYNNENLIYTKKYSNGTFSITTPTQMFKNCEFINGYPHFNIPLDKCLEEIEFFLSNESMYNNQFYIRYGDTHPHKSIPKLAQVRNLIIENSLSNMIGLNSRSFYGIGDISLKSLADFIDKFHIEYNSEELFIKVVNNDVSKDILLKLEKYDLDALKQISTFLKSMQLTQKEFLLESTLYKNQNLYKSIKNNPKFSGNLKDNGELKYSLQELIFINSLLKNNSDILINIIGANQNTHVLKVNELLNGSFDVRNRFLTYEICRNADDRKINVWSEKLDEFIEGNKLKINDDYINYQELLKILVIINSNDVIIDYNKLEKYKSSIFKFNKIITRIDNLNNDVSIKDGNDLIYKMALVCYNLNRSIEIGNQSNFYRYVVNVVNEYEANKEKYIGVQGLYKNFLIKCFERLGYKRKEQIKELRR